jgi:hypothetical protein
MSLFGCRTKVAGTDDVAGARGASPPRRDPALQRQAELTIRRCLSCRVDCKEGAACSRARECRREITYMSH